MEFLFFLVLAVGFVVLYILWENRPRPVVKPPDEWSIRFEARHSRALELASQITFPTSAQFTETVIKRLPPVHPPRLQRCIVNAISGIYSKELPHVPAHMPDHNDPVVWTPYNFAINKTLAKLEEPQRFLAELSDIIATRLINFLAVAPQAARPSLFTTLPTELQRLEMLKSLRTWITDDFGFFHWAHIRQLKSDDPYDTELRQNPFYDYMREAFDIPIPLNIPPDSWFSSTWVCAPQGKGKTNLLHNIIKDRRPNGTVILMDAKGELISPYLDEAIVIEPSLDKPPPINPLDIGSSIHAVELLEYLFSALLEAKMTPKQSTLFSGVLTLLVTVPNATVETFRQVLTHGWKPYEQYVNRLPQRDREFFTAGTFDSKGYTATKEEILWRLQLLLRNPYMAAMLEVPRTRLDMGQLMDSGHIIVINNNPDVLGDLGAEFFGRFMLSLVWNAVRARANSGSKTPVYFIIDEAQTVISRDDNIPKLIHQCRSQNVALIFAHQELQQMKTDDVKGALSNCAIRFCAPDGETAVLAPRFRTTPEFLASLPPYHFAACIRDKETVAVTVPFLKMHVIERTKPVGDFDLHWDITISPRVAAEGGLHKVADDFTIRLPPNVQNGTTLCVKGKGAPKPDGTFGNLYLHISVPLRPNQRAIGRGPEEIG